MNPIQIVTTLTSDTLHLPALAPLVGKKVVITVAEAPAPARPDGLPTPEQLAVRHRAAERLSRSTYNWNILAELDAADIADQERKQCP